MNRNERDYFRYNELLVAFAGAATPREVANPGEPGEGLGNGNELAAPHRHRQRGPYVLRAYQEPPRREPVAAGSAGAPSPALTTAEWSALAQRLLALEARPGVRRSRVACLLDRARATPAAQWALRVLVGRALGSGDDEAGVGPEALLRLLGPMGIDRWQLRAAVAGRRDSLLATGLVVEAGPDYALPLGIAQWLRGDDVDCIPGLTLHPLAEPHPALAQAAARMAVAFGAGGPFPVSCKDPSFVEAFARSVAATRGRGLLVARAGPGDEGAPLRALVGLVATHDTLDVLLLSHDEEPAQPAPHARAEPGVLTLTWADPVEELPFLHAHRGRAPTRACVPLDRLRQAALTTLAAERLGGRAPPANLGWAALDGLGPLMAPLLVACDGLDGALGTLGALACPGEAQAEPAVSCTLDDLVVDDAVELRLRAVAAEAGRGRRAVILLHGPPGSGKSFAARCLAGSLGRPVKPLVSSELREMYYGETEKRLAEVFESASQEGAVVVIDEADEWLGARQGSSAAPGGARVGEVSSMLLLLERFQGVAVLTTNRTAALDAAVSRRVDHWIELGLPDVECRMALWAGALAPRDREPGLELAPGELVLLASVHLTGGDIAAIVRQVRSTGLSAKNLLAAARERSERARLAWPS